MADKYEEAQEDSYVDGIEAKLSISREQEKNQQRKLEHFRNLFKSFYDIYQLFHLCTPIYNWDQALSNALLRNYPLDLDPVLVSIKENILQEVISLTNDRIDAFIRDLDTSLLLNRNNLSLIANDYGAVVSNDIEHALGLAFKLVNIPFKESALDLNHALGSYIDVLSKSRPLGRDRGESKLLRLYIRYFARELANHLSYWSWKELPKPFLSQKDIDMHQRVIDSYLDVYVAFAILEERIEERLPACEGILIVKETTPTQKNQKKS